MAVEVTDDVQHCAGVKSRALALFGIALSFGLYKPDCGDWAMAAVVAAIETRSVVLVASRRQRKPPPETVVWWVHRLCPTNK